MHDSSILLQRFFIYSTCLYPKTWTAKCWPMLSSRTFSLRGQSDPVLPPARPRPTGQVVTPMKRLLKSRNVSKLSATLSNRARGDYSRCSKTFVRI